MTTLSLIQQPGFYDKLTAQTAKLAAKPGRCRQGSGRDLLRRFGGRHVRHLLPAKTSRPATPK
ncbi:hypothetical protein LP419_25530 [Massilia sp. H-1]|nr:hypothetical protein LP419_25530 [Massilia sp. H-1]